MHVRALVLALVLAGCVTPQGGAPPEESQEPRSLALGRGDAPVRFLAFGDGGYGNEQQEKSARAAAQVCEANGCDLVLLLGDNVYDDGPTSPHDPQFEAKFERPYAPLDMPFYVVLGNHDAAGAEHELAYAQREDRLTQRWTMPARQYAFDEGAARFVALDLTAPGPDQQAEAARLLDGEAPWTIAYSHFPLRSNGKHGDAVGGTRASLEASVCGRADLYLAGHDHDLQWLAAPADCAGTELVVSGAMGKARPLRENATNEAHFAQGETHGFFWFEVDRDRLVGRAYDDEGRLLFERTLRR